MSLGSAERVVVGLSMVFGAEITKTNSKPRSGGAEAWQATEIAFDLWPLCSQPGLSLRLGSRGPPSSCPVITAFIAVSNIWSKPVLGLFPLSADGKREPVSPSISSPA